MQRDVHSLKSDVTPGGLFAAGDLVRVHASKVPEAREGIDSKSSLSATNSPQPHFFS
jgi:hypothetical protein